MTVIDKISFRFRMADEQFARNLYADWDGFCRRCVTDILEDGEHTAGEVLRRVSGKIAGDFGEEFCAVCHRTAACIFW